MFKTPNLLGNGSLSRLRELLFTIALHSSPSFDMFWFPMAIRQLPSWRTALGNYLKTLDNVEKLEVLPYHSMGQSKYESMGMEYPLKGTPQLTKDQAKAAEFIIRRAWGREL